MGPLSRLSLWAVTQAPFHFYSLEESAVTSMNPRAEAASPSPSLPLSFPPSLPTLVIPGLGPNPCWLRLRIPWAWAEATSLLHSFPPQGFASLCRHPGSGETEAAHGT